MSDEKNEISKVPPPIEPLSGGGPTFFVWETTAIRPNWEEWKHTPQVQAWQACALSLDIEPHSMKSIPDGWMDSKYCGHNQVFVDESFPSEDIKTKFKSRLRVLLANLVPKGSFFHSIVNHEDPQMGIVPLPEFAEWCASVEWNIPPELAALAKKPDAAPATKEENKLTPSTPIKSEKRQEIKGVEKQQIINSFKEIHYKDWSKQLSTPRFWLEPCRVAKGSKTKSALWNPVCIALELLDKKAEIKSFDQKHLRTVTLKDFDRIFDNLQDWTDKWHEKSELLR